MDNELPHSFMLISAYDFSEMDECRFHYESDSFDTKWPSRKIISDKITGSSERIVTNIFPFKIPSIFIKLDACFILRISVTCVVMNGYNLKALAQTNKFN